MYVINLLNHMTCSLDIKDEMNLVDISFVYEGQSINSGTFDVTQKLMFWFLWNLAQSINVTNTTVMSCAHIMSHNAQLFWISWPALALKNSELMLKLSFIKELPA